MASDGYNLAESDRGPPLTSPTLDGPAPHSKSADNSDGGGGGSGDAGAAASKTSKVSRKRTKTGCLTCRKRRIKCGEERPTCGNCIKSKRVCEGYNQRVVFKDGMHGLYPPRAIGPANPRFAPQYVNLQPAPPGPSHLQRPIAPAPPLFRDDGITPLDQTLPPHLRAHYEERAQNLSAYDGPRLNVHVPLSPPGLREGEYQFQEPLPSPGYPDHQYSPDRYHQHTPASATAAQFAIQSTHIKSEHDSNSLFGPHPSYSPPAPQQQQPQQQQRPQYEGQSGSMQAAYSPPQSSAPPTSANNCPLHIPLDRKYAEVSGTRAASHQPNHDYSDIFNQCSDLPESGVGGGASHPECCELPEGYAHGQSEIDLDQESEDDMDDDEEDGEYMIGTQEDGMIMMETAGPGGQTMGTRQQISHILEPFSRHLDEHSRISFRSFLPEVGVLATYRPTLSSSPLMNPITAKIFCHFVYVLGPRLHGPQNVWSYTVPILSLSHPPLLHAILALSSLHISKLTHGPNEPSLRHYHIALRRLGKAIASDRHRGHVATLAATLMLAYYETMAAEHDKWSSHIHGAKQLLREIDFERVTRRVELIDVEEASGEEQADTQYAAAPGRPSLLTMRKIRRHMIAEDVDETLQSYLMGGKRRRGNAQKPHRRTADRPFTKKELETLKLQADMFWWYAKMDCYQSLLSGCPLVLDYVHWGQCPPRARIGTLGTTYGSSDHYFLLLGRLCDFQVRDLKRKRAVFAANGGVWMPPPEMGGPPRGRRGPPMGNGMPPPQSPYGPPPGQANRMDEMQFGMIPTPSGQPQMPRAFQQGLAPGEQQIPNHRIPEPLPESEDLDAAYDEAELEWNEIGKAFDVLQESLGAEYQPLGIDYMTPTSSTPFGPAIYYRTYSIATLQMLYNMAMLVLHRCHPSMPPVAMMATTIQACKTHTYAVDIARIVAGLVPTDSSTQINPALGASLIEATMPMFFAAVQYDNDDQRAWIVKKLREINRLTGWATASRILLGCQRAWEKAAELNVGPVYNRPPFEEEEDMFYEYQEYFIALQNGAREEEEELEAGDQNSGGRFLWKVAARRTVDAAGILGGRDEITRRG